MATKKISELVLTETLTDTDIIPVVNENETKKVAMSSIKEYTKPNEATTDTAGLLSAEDKAKIDNNTANNHTHNNKEILDNTTASYTTEEQTKLTNIEEQAQVNKIETIKLNGVEVTPIEKIVDLIISTDSGEGGGTTDYSALSNKPKINNVELSGNKTSADLGLAEKTHTHTTTDITDLSIPTATSQLTNDSGYVASIEVNNIKVLTEAEYTALTEYGANTLYIVPNE